MRLASDASRVPLCRGRPKETRIKIHRDPNYRRRGPRSRLQKLRQLLLVQPKTKRRLAFALIYAVIFACVALLLYLIFAPDFRRCRRARQWSEKCFQSRCFSLIT